MLIELPIAKYTFAFKAKDDITIPSYSGTLWHSVFGKALRDVSCITPDAACESCLFYRQCDYPFLFRGVLPNTEKQSNLIAPHIFTSTALQTTKIQKHGIFYIELALVGSAIQRFDKIMQAMRQVGQNGLGMERKTAELVQVTQKNPDGYECLPRTQNTDNIAITIPNAPEKIRLQWLTQLRFSGKAANQKTFASDFFFMMIIRRISSLQYYYTGKPLIADYALLKTLTQTIPLDQTHLEYIQHKDLNHRRCMHKQNSGWQGHMDMDLSQHKALWSFLYLGQWVNVGKNANMGFGNYQLIHL